MKSLNNRFDILMEVIKMYYIKFSKESQVINVQGFSSHAERERYLYEHGFVDGRTGWYHPFTKASAGLFEAKSAYHTTMSLYKSCDKKLQTSNRFMYAAK